MRWTCLVVVDCGQGEGSYGDATEIKGKHNTLSGWFI
jgi:hypothetical protein